MVAARGQARLTEKDVRALALALIVAFALPVFIWWVWYRTVGYSTLTLTLAQGMIFVAGLSLIAGLRLGWRRIGLGGRDLARAVVVVAAAYGLLALVVLGLQQAGVTSVPLLRQAYSTSAFFDNWFLTGLGEELLFAGVLFTLVAGRLGPRRWWLAVLIVALLFALWHLPGYLAMGRTGVALLGRLALNAASWGFFGAIYALSGNLWLAALAHAATNYPLLPAITEEPIVGFTFMSCLVAAGWWLGRGRRRETLPRPGRQGRYQEHSARGA